MEHKPEIPTLGIFSEVAPKYEFLNTVMTAGMDRRWRHTMLEVCESALGKSPLAILDLATGTGDVARLMAERWPLSQVVGSDPTPAMLQLAREKALKEKDRKNKKVIEIGRAHV